MVTRRARRLVSLCVVFALLPLLSTTAGAGEVGARAAMAWMRFDAKSPSSAQPASTSSAATDAHHPPVTPFAPAPPFSSWLSTSAPAGATFVSQPFVAAAPTRLHPARAPPALP